LPAGRGGGPARYSGVRQTANTHQAFFA
jgi:hypothetical protein